MQVFRERTYQKEGIKVKIQRWKFKVFKVELGG